MQDTIRHVGDLTHPVAIVVQQRAAATIRRHALDADDRQELLDALGLPASLADDPPGP